jgi:hypothetical protein
MQTVDPHTLGANIFLLIGLLIASGLVLFLLIGGWTALKIVVWKRRQRHAQAEYRRQRVAPNGQPYPPASRGVCAQCGAYCGAVFHLTTGERLCRRHFDVHCEFSAEARRGSEPAGVRHALKGGD